MEILLIIKDEIIESLFLKKYKELLVGIELTFGKADEKFRKEIESGRFNLVICDLDANFNLIMDLYGKQKDKVPFLFITDLEYSNFLGALKEERISNIFPKGLLIEDYVTSSKMILNLCKGNIFGIHNYTEYPVFLETMTVHYSSEIRKLSLKIDFLFPYLNKEKAMRIKLAFYEIASNAFFHSHSLEKGGESYISDPIFISFAEDSEKILFSITDKRGTLDKNTVFYWLFKRFHEDGALPDNHGRGFFLMKNIIDNLIININKEKMTEFIAIFYKSEYMGEKSLLIQQI